MDFAFSTEQDELRAVVRGFLADRSPEPDVRRLMETSDGFDPTVWKEMGEDLGILGLAIPEEYGGAGCGIAEVGVVLEEAGRALLCAPYFSSVLLASYALLHSGDEAAKADYLPGLASGQLRGTLALTEDDGRWDEGGIALRAHRSAAGWTLDGHKSFVIDGGTADVLVVAARTSGGVSLFVVDGAAPGLATTAMATMDLTRKQARLEFSGVRARLIGVEDGGWPVLSRVLDLAAVGLAAEQVGGAARVMEMAVDYVKVRHQFGRAIGSFQAVKHSCANMLVDVECARSAAYYGLWTAAADSDEQQVAASLAKAYCSEAYVRCAGVNIQLHGGIGFTWEHPAHLYLRRAKSSQLLFGDSAFHRDLLAQRVGI
ncbi:acyl-CoA dehydrogenase family protein [Pseudofrankia inefficax]|uniref:Acyl-CoA dehydrogenase domain-containing protein n=1 Tax=Pseudofrankia inefficax (strain DSM 45817 / CECT 9037 / DDB 130130 / EuI1c) TaxID=298654 RepID=E3J908_PSEI1|nr:acyl-CoA dehydrogenase family protein [Pseudofrankia inefficax]ADP80887.1 acyl-CoA dehydrogenase domain-containing protein [Pseudofrankia inefficax]